MCHVTNERIPLKITIMGHLFGWGGGGGRGTSENGSTGLGCSCNISSLPNELNPTPLNF